MIKKKSINMTKNSCDMIEFCICMIARVSPIINCRHVINELKNELKSALITPKLIVAKFTTPTKINAIKKRYAIIFTDASAIVC